MKPSRVELHGDQSTVLVVPDHEHGIFLVHRDRRSRTDYMIGRSALVVGVVLSDAERIEEGDFSALDGYVRHISSETGLIAAGNDQVWLRRERDGTGPMAGYDRIRYMEEYSPNPDTQA